MHSLQKSLVITETDVESMSLSEEDIKKLKKIGGGWPAAVDLAEILSLLSEDVRELWVDPVNGLDTNTGLSPSSPLKSVQLAVILLKQPYGLPHWGLNDNRTIHVMGAAGTVLTESIGIPPHAGPGALIIQGEETKVAEDLVLSATPFSKIAGYEIDQTLNLDGASLTANTHQYNGFVVPQVSLVETEFDVGYDQLPIRDNSASSLTVTVYDPGYWSAFSYVGGALVDIVRPNITWRPEDSAPTSYFNGPAINNIGGALIVRGFEVKQAAVGGDKGPFIQNNGCGAPFTLSSTVLQRILVTGAQFSRFLSGHQVMTMGMIFDDPDAYPVMASNDAMIQNFLGRCGFVDFDGPQRTAVYGASLDASGNSVGGLRFRNGFNSANHVAADLRASGSQDTQFGVFSGAYVHFGPLSVEDAGDLNCIQVQNACVDLKIGSNQFRTVGSANNNGVGLAISEGSWGTAANEANITLSGAGGDMAVGSLPAREWTAGSQTDTVELSRYRT